MLKAQINIHFIISLVIFLGVVIYLIHVLLTSYPLYDRDIKSDLLYAKAYQVSELLIKSPGYPKDWNSTNFERVGLISEPYLLEQSKISELEKICNTTNLIQNKKFLDSFGLADNILSIDINYLNGTRVLECHPGGEILNRKASIKRISVLGDSLVEVWIYVG